MKHIMQGCLALLFTFVISAFAATPPESPIIWISSAEAAVHPEVAEREMKKSKDYEVSDVYNRAHHIIYGSKAPMGPDGRTRIAVIINGDETLVIEDRIKNDIYSQLRNKFPREDFALMKGTDINTKLITMLEARYSDASSSDRIILTPSTTTVERNNTAAGGVPADRIFGAKTVTLDDIVTAGRACQYDYVFLVTMAHGGYASYTDNGFTDTERANVWLHIRFVDVGNGDYLYRNDIAAQGKVHNGNFNGRLFERSVHNGIQEAMNDIAIVED